VILTPLELICIAIPCVILIVVLVALWPMDLELPMAPETSPLPEHVRILEPSARPFDWQDDPFWRTR